MTHYDETAGSEDPQSLLSDIALIVNVDEDAVALPSEPTDNELWGEDNLRELSSTPPAVVLAAVDLVIPPQEVSLQARHHMIESAQRALADRRKAHGLLPVLLRDVRERIGLSTTDVAERAAIPKAKLDALETGDAVVDNQLPVSTTVAWIGALPVDHSLALDALRRSLQFGWTNEFALAAGEADFPRNVEDYVLQVADGLATAYEGDSR